MNQIEIAHFKAFDDPIVIDATDKHQNILLFGENGAGKTSLYEAIQLVFFRQRLMAPHLTIGGTRELRRNEEADFIYSYAHRGTNEQPYISINGQQGEFDTRNYDCYMISGASLQTAAPETDAICLPQMLRQAFFSTLPQDVAPFLERHLMELIDRVNQDLSHCFNEDIQTGIEDTQTLQLYIADPKRQLRQSNQLHRLFNEAAIHLTRLLLLLNTIQLLDAQSDRAHKILVLDDIVTSLDAANRSFLTQYILSRFNGFQKIVLTHNVGYNNLFACRIDHSGERDQWLKLNLYATERGIHLYCYDRMQTADMLKKAFDKGELSPETIGNEIRKRLEATAHELAKIYCLGSVETSADILKRLASTDRPLYLAPPDGPSGHPRRADDLVAEIRALADRQPQTPLAREITALMEQYQTPADTPQLAAAVREIKIYKKTLLHQLSHAYTATPPLVGKEVSISLQLLSQLETHLKHVKKNIGMM